ncbi:hypothetical protein S40288_07082 [Stachybotrys chartarum IBT 40288]|nr:hypothetical protein S40288_07082 [Stachybotrys chartarum IBT 40288]
MLQSDFKPGMDIKVDAHGVPIQLCGNWIIGGHDGCTEIGKFACSNCGLAVYCSEECEKACLNEHKTFCRQDMVRGDWVPDWVRQKRRPKFCSNRKPEATGLQEKIWGDVPAIDVLKLGANEGEDYNKTIRVLFADSGDLRNMVKTIADLPTAFNGRLEITMNDSNAHIAARNVLLTLIGLISKNPREAALTMMNVWYSAKLRKYDYILLKASIGPIVKRVIDSMAGNPDQKVAEVNWNYGPTKVKIALSVAGWHKLLSLCSIADDQMADHIMTSRLSLVMMHKYPDASERRLYYLQPKHRIPHTRFMAEGIIAPFSYPRGDWCCVNPTLIHEKQWAIESLASPTQGWDMRDVLATPVGIANNDVFGKLFHHNLAVFTAFATRCKTNDISLTFLNLDPLLLRAVVPVKDGYDRIEVGTLADSNNLGMAKTLYAFGELLQTRKTNPHATLITRCSRAVQETITVKDEMRALNIFGHVQERLSLYMPLPKEEEFEHLYDPRLVKLAHGRDLCDSYEGIFKRYFAKNHLDEVAEAFLLQAKKKHTVVEKWPFALECQPGDENAQEEFDRLVGYGPSPKERYVEWKPLGRSKPKK